MITKYKCLFCNNIYPSLPEGNEDYIAVVICHRCNVTTEDLTFKCECSKGVTLKEMNNSPYLKPTIDKPVVKFGRYKI